MQDNNLIAKVFFGDNVEYRHLDKDGNVKPIFQENKFAVWLMKHNLLSPLWINGFLANFDFLFGHWADKKIASNVVVNAARAVISARLYGTSLAAFGAIGCGTGTTAAAAGDTALQTGVKTDGTGDAGVHAIATASVTWSSVTTTQTNDTAQAVGTATYTASIAITESGVFNADTNGTMLAHQVFTAVNVVSGDSIQFTWKIKNA
jgi:hypothetical protein